MNPVNDKKKGGGGNGLCFCGCVADCTLPRLPVADEKTENSVVPSLKHMV